MVPGKMVPGKMVPDKNGPDKNGLREKWSPENWQTNLKFGNKKSWGERRASWCVCEMFGCD